MNDNLNKILFICLIGSLVLNGLLSLALGKVIEQRDAARHYIEHGTLESF